MRHILILFFCLFIGSLYGQIVRVDSTVIYESRSIYNQAGYYIGKDSFHVKQVRLAYCNDTFYERNDTLIGRYPKQFITTDSLGDYATKAQVRDSIGTIDSDHDGVADDADLLDGENGSYYLNRANHYGNQDTLTITGLGEFTEDRMASKIIAGTGISKSYNDTTGELTISSTVTGDLTGVSVTGYLTGGGTSGVVTIGIDTSGTVGVATKYDLSDMIDGSGNVHYVPKFSDSNTLTDSQIMDDSGDVDLKLGNGTSTVSLNYNDSRALEIKNEGTKHTVIKGRAIASNQNGTIITHNLDKELDLISGSYDGYFIDLGGSGYSSISTATEGVFINKENSSAVESNLFTIKNDGKVGIGGITEPSATLHVDGTLKVTSQTGTPTKILGVDASGNVGEVGKGYGISVSGGNVLVDTTKIATQYDLTTLGSGDITEVTVTNYLTGGGTSGSVSIGMDTTGTVGVATKYDLKDFQTGAQVRDSIGTIDSNHDGNADNASKLEGQGSSYYLNRANHTGTQDTTTISGLGEFVEDRAGAKIVAGTGITTSYNDATGETTINATGSGTGDITAVNVSGYLTGGGTSGDVTIGVDTSGTVGLATKYDLTTSSGTTNLTYSGTSSPITLNSSSGSDVTITAGTGISLTGTSSNMTINTTGLVSGTGTQYQIPRFSGTSSLEGVSGFTLNASNVFSIPNNLEQSPSGSSTTTPRVLGVTGFADGNAARWQFGDALNSIQNSYGGRMLFQSYWGIEFYGSRQNLTAQGFSVGASNDPAVNIYSPAAARIALAITAASGQSANLLEFRNSSLGVQSRFTSAGNFIGSNQSVPVDLNASTGALRLPIGTDAQRPAATTGYVRYSTTNSALEYSTGSGYEVPLKATAATGLGTANKLFYADANGRATTGNLHWDNANNKLGINSASPSNSLQINGSLGRNAPTTTTGTTYSFSGESVTWLIVNAAGTCTVTLPTASSYSGREITIKTITANTVISNASNVKPIDSDTAGTAILPATAGSWALLVSDGTNWIVMQKG